MQIKSKIRQNFQSKNYTLRLKILFTIIFIPKNTFHLQKQTCSQFRQFNFNERYENMKFLNSVLDAYFSTRTQIKVGYQIISVLQVQSKLLPVILNSASKKKLGANYSTAQAPINKVIHVSPYCVSSKQKEKSFNFKSNSNQTLVLFQSRAQVWVFNPSTWFSASLKELSSVCRTLKSRPEFDPGIKFNILHDKSISQSLSLHMLH